MATPHARELGTGRVTRHTRAEHDARIHHDVEQRLAWYANHPERIAERLRALDDEWNIERALQANAASLSMFGATMALLGGRKWLLLPGLVGGFLLNHAVRGWCPPLNLMRRLGFRTQEEIDYERYALKLLLGDFKDVATHDADAALTAARF